MNPDKTYEATEMVTTELTPVEEEYDAPSFFGSFVRDIAESVAGNLSNEDVILTDVLHATEVETLASYIFTLRETGVRINGVNASEHFAEAEQKIHDRLVENAKFMGSDPDEEFLHEVADYIVDEHIIQESYYGARAEEVSGKSVCKAEGWTFVAESGIIAHELGIEHPEARGIDLWFPEPDITAQVKRGTGGDMDDDCEADVLLRLVAPDEDSEHNYPEIRWFDLRD